MDYVKKDEEEIIFDSLGCSVCSSKFSSEVELKNHLASEHIFSSLFGFIGDSEENNINNKNSAMKRYRGLKKHRKPKKFVNCGSEKCNECDYSTNFPYNLKKHKESIHQKLLKFICNLCDYRSYFKASVQSHISSNHKDIAAKVLKIDCVKCQARKTHEMCEKLWKDITNTKLGRKKGRQNKHPRKINGNYSCIECDYSTNFPKNLYVHKQAKHQNLVKFSCNLCEYKSYYRQCVSSHITYNHKEITAKILKIDCSKCQVRESHVMCEKKYDKTKKKHICNECDFSTNIKRSLKSHSDIVHQGIVLYNCNLCNYKSYYKAAVRGHISAKHEETSGKVLKINCGKCQAEEEHEKCGKMKKNKKENKETESEPKITKTLLKIIRQMEYLKAMRIFTVRNAKRERFTNNVNFQNFLKMRKKRRLT